MSSRPSPHDQSSCRQQFLATGWRLAVKINRSIIKCQSGQFVPFTAAESTSFATIVSASEGPEFSAFNRQPR
eukprot:SAG11_NODE_17747_length_510_cov_0.620438_1_plen_72_part_00